MATDFSSALVLPSQVSTRGVGAEGGLPTRQRWEPRSDRTPSSGMGQTKSRRDGLVRQKSPAKQTDIVEERSVKYY